VHTRHPDVEKDDVGLGAADERDGLAAVRGLADDLELAGLLERATDAVEDQTVVVGQQYACLETFGSSNHVLKSAGIARLSTGSPRSDLREGLAHACGATNRRRENELRSVRNPVVNSVRVV